MVVWGRSLVDRVATAAVGLVRPIVSLWDPAVAVLGIRTLARNPPDLFTQMNRSRVDDLSKRTWRTPPGRNPLPTTVTSPPAFATPRTRTRGW
jgi:hypothetical protein